MSYQLAGKRVRPKVFYYDYAPSTHSHTRCSRTGSDRQLKRSCRLGHSPFREAKTPKRVEEFFGFSKFWISADKRRSCVISNAVFGAHFKQKSQKSPPPPLPARYWSPWQSFFNFCNKCVYVKLSIMVSCYFLVLDCKKIGRIACRSLFLC